MQITNETMEFLWLGAGAVALWMLLPTVLSALGLTFSHCYIDDDAGDLVPSGDDAEYEDLFAQLRRLGFEPVGRRSTTYWIHLIHWYRKYQSRVFASRQGDVIATVYKLWAWEDRWRLGFVTAFSDESIVETANQMENHRIEEPDHLRWGLATTDRGLLLERHREVCRDFAAAGPRSVAVLPAGEVNRLIHHHEARFSRKQWWVGLVYMTIPLFCLGIGLLPVLLIAGATSFLVPVSIIAWGLLWPAVQALLFRYSASRSRAEDASHKGDQPSTHPIELGTASPQSQQ